MAGLAPVVGDPGPPAILPPGGPAPARVVVGAVTADMAAPRVLPSCPAPPRTRRAVVDRTAEAVRRTTSPNPAQAHDRSGARLNKDIDRLYARHRRTAQ
ncbi:MAG: hypothetical protein HZY76_09450 [Anaerolineae bacterium]|nr:MAG: hypothetical protein HZY76_09450 [Anaerolineae bacterium]